jgi:hypothetical protein
MWRPRNAGVRGGTTSSNLLCSSSESANHQFRRGNGDRLRQNLANMGYGDFWFGSKRDQCIVARVRRFGVKVAASFVSQATAPGVRRQAGPHSVT